MSEYTVEADNTLNDDEDEMEMEFGKNILIHKMIKCR